LGVAFLGEKRRRLDSKTHQGTWGFWEKKKKPRTGKEFGDRIKKKLGPPPRRGEEKTSKGKNLRPSPQKKKKRGVPSRGRKGGENLLQPKLRKSPDLKGSNNPFNSSEKDRERRFDSVHPREGGDQNL